MLNGDNELRVAIDGMEINALKRFANIFYSYRPTSVWSSPEVLASPKKILDPLPNMDIYSFGILMWELFHEKLPFDNNLSECTTKVFQDERPPIKTQENLDDEADEA